MTQPRPSRPYDDILTRLRAVRGKSHRVAMFYGALLTMLVGIVLTLVAIVLEQVFAFGIVGRTVLFLLTGIGTLLFALWYFGRPFLRLIGVLQSEDETETARRVGKHFPHIRDRLLDALEMYRARETSRKHYSLDLIDASFADLYQSIRSLDFRESVNDFHVRRLRKVVVIAVSFFVLMFVIPPFGFYGSFDRILHFGTSFASPRMIELSIEPGNIDVVRGQSVSVTVRVQGAPVKSLSLYTREHGRLEFESLALNPTTSGEFRTELSNLKTSLDYYAAVDDIQSDRYSISVFDRPLVRSLQLTVRPPAYTRLPMKTFDENMGDVSAYPGSKVNFKILASKEISSATIVFGDSTLLPLNASGIDAEGAMVVRKNNSYRVRLTDTKSLVNLDPVEYSIKIISDEVPIVELLAPGRNIDLTERMNVDLFIRARDDFGFSKLRLAYRLAQSRYEQPAVDFSFITLPLPSDGRSTIELPYHWDVSSLNLVPEDAIAYYVEAFDNDDVTGPKSGRSETYLLRLPSLEEVFTDVSGNQQQSLESMQNVAKETQQLKKDVEELQREMKKGAEKANWQQQKKADQMMQRYEAMKKSLQESSEKMDEMVKKMEDNKLVSSQTMEKYLELQKLMEQLMSPELQEALKKLQQSMKQLSPEEMKQSMEQLKANEDQFRKNLERTIELLKRIAIEQKIDELVKRAEEMKKQQEKVREQAAKTPSPDQKKKDELAKQQEDLKKQAASMEKETSELRKNMEEFSKEMPMQEMKKAEEQLQKSQLQKKMQRSAQQMQAGEMKKAEGDQKESEEDLSEFKDQMEQVQKNLQENQQKQIVNEMRKQLQDVLELSEREEALKEDSKSIDPNSRRFRESAQRQNEIQNDLKNSADAMAGLAKKTFAISPEMGGEIGNAMKQMSEALQQMEARNPGGSTAKQAEAMGSLNRAAMMMQNALGAMGKGGKGGKGMAGLMGRLGEMAGQQGGINNGTQQAMGMGGQGGEMSAEQQAQYNRLGGQQAALQKSLQELSNEAKNTGEFSKLLGDLDRVAKQMAEVQTDFEQSNVNPQTVQKQERILSRLLDSQRSVRERDFEKRRRAESGSNSRRTSPGEIDLSTQEGKNFLRQEMLKMKEGKFSKDYEALIRKYFEHLEKGEVQQ